MLLLAGTSSVVLSILGLNVNAIPHGCYVYISESEKLLCSLL
jgi:hypothetical protein